MDGQCMDRAGQFVGQRLVDKSVTVDAAFACKPFGHYMDTKMSFTLRAMPDVPRMQMRLVYDLQLARRKRRFQFCFDCVFYGHDR